MWLWFQRLLNRSLSSGYECPNGHSYTLFTFSGYCTTCGHKLTKNESSCCPKCFYPYLYPLVGKFCSKCGHKIEITQDSALASYGDKGISLGGFGTTMEKEVSSPL